MKTFAICFVALFAVAIAKSVIDDVGYVNGDYRFSVSGPNFDDKIEKIDDRIVGGEPTTIEKHPHQISLRFGGGNAHICSGSIISPTRALSAAHCRLKKTDPEQYSIVAGSTTRTGDINAQVRILTQFVTHNEYDTPHFAHDISIMFWEEPLTLGDNVRPIQLPLANASVPYGQDATASGWGRIRHEGPLAHILQVVTQPLVTSEECQRANSEKITEDMVCWGGQEGKGGCNGDSGGPLVHNNTLVGITSWGQLPCASEGHPTVYARVAFFIDWINENM